MDPPTRYACTVVVDKRLLKERHTSDMDLIRPKQSFAHHDQGTWPFSSFASCAVLDSRFFALSNDF